MPLPDDRLGERACAAIIVHEGQTAPTLAELQEFLDGEGVAKYTWPESVEVFGQFPRTPSLKVVKRDVVQADPQARAGHGLSEMSRPGVLRRMYELIDGPRPNVVASCWRTTCGSRSCSPTGRVRRRTSPVAGRSSTATSRSARRRPGRTMCWPSRRTARSSWCSARRARRACRSRRSWRPRRIDADGRIDRYVVGRSTAVLFGLE